MSEEINIKELLDDLNRQYQNRSFWRKLKDWWLYPKGHKQMAINEKKLTGDQYFLFKIHQQQIHDSARTHQLLMITWVAIHYWFYYIYGSTQKKLMLFSMFCKQNLGV